MLVLVSLLVGSALSPATEPSDPVASTYLGTPVPTSAEDEGWRFSITPYVWMYGIDGDVRIRDTTAEVDFGFDEILDSLDLALTVRVEAWKDRLGFYVDPSFGVLESEADTPGGEADIDTELVLVDFGALFRVLERTTDEGRARSADVYLGGRYLYLKNEIDLPLAADKEQSRDGVDLTVGARYGMDVTERLGFLVSGDVGGFGLGSSSELSWNAQGLGSFRVGDSGRLWAGYRVLDVDRDDGGSSGLDFTFSGPIVGYEFRL
jgi:hypothetical protein